MTFNPEFVIIENFLSDDDLKIINDEIKNNEKFMQASNILNGHATFNRWYPHPNTTIPNIMNKMLYSKEMHEKVKNYTDPFWKLFTAQLLSGFEVQVTEYLNSAKHKYDWHVDHLPNTDNPYLGIRMLNYILYFSNITEGGELQIADWDKQYIEGEINYKILKSIKPAVNKLVIIPSWYIHRVTPVLTENEKRHTINGHMYVKCF